MNKVAGGFHRLGVSWDKGTCACACVCACACICVCTCVGECDYKQFGSWNIKGKSGNDEAVKVSTSEDSSTIK